MRLLSYFEPKPFVFAHRKVKIKNRVGLALMVLGVIFIYFGVM